MNKTVVIVLFFGALATGVGLSLLMPDNEPDHWVSTWPTWLQWSVSILGYLSLVYMVVYSARRLYRRRKQCRT